MTIEEFINEEIKILEGFKNYAEKQFKCKEANRDTWKNNFEHIRDELVYSEQIIK